MTTRQQIMDFFRSDDFQEHLTTDDAIEIFVSVLKGESDKTYATTMAQALTLLLINNPNTMTNLNTMQAVRNTLLNADLQHYPIFQHMRQRYTINDMIQMDKTLKQVHQSKKKNLIKAINAILTK